MILVHSNKVKGENMKLVDYAESIKRLAKKHPDATVVFASDEEGNSFHELNFHPSS